MRTEDAARAWQILRRIPSYRNAWRRSLPQPGLPERAPFPVRLQTAADLAAARFGLHAWEDPFAEDGPASPFWHVVAPMLPAAADPRATPLNGAAADGLSVAGLRLIDGSLVVKLENGAAAMQLAIERGGGFGPGDGVLAQHDLLADPRAFLARLRNARELAAGEPPRRGGVRGTGDGDLLKAVEGLAAGKKLPQIALDVYGPDTIKDRGLHADGDLRAAARRLVKKARFLMKGGYLELAAGRRPRL